jgi:serine phosphatase RsbU (regulator of sigma subunit)
MARLTLQPYGVGSKVDSSGPLSLPESQGWISQTFFRPSVRVGNHFFGGDWYAGRQLEDGSFWVFLADVTGHGYYAYLLASGLPAVWQRCWSAHPNRPPEPAEFLACMHELIADCLPEGFFLECTLVRLGVDGRTTVVAAGGTRFWLRRGSHRPDLVKLRGAWLGLRAPVTNEQHTLSLGDNDELLLATDGVFDQLENGAGEELNLPTSPQAGLFEVVRGLLEKSLASSPQKDDITMVLLRRRAQPADEPRSASGGLSRAGRNGTGDVPV